MRFAVISDLHFGSAAIQAQKPMVSFLERASKPDVDFVAVTGDLTDNGYDGIVTCPCFATWNNAFVGGGKENELGEFDTEFVTPLTIAHKPLYLIQGNHDTYNGASRFPVARYITRRYGNTYYLVEREGVIMAFLDIYPTETIRTWLKTQLTKRKAFENKTPILLFTHYNLMDAFSDWWPEPDKAAFQTLLKDANILGIFVGHNHTSYQYIWQGFHVYSSAGLQYIIADVQDGKLSVQFLP